MTLNGMSSDPHNGVNNLNLILMRLTPLELKNLVSLGIRACISALIAK